MKKVDEYSDEQLIEAQMKCAACQANMILKKGEIDLRVKGKLYLVRDIFYEECPSCGEKVLLPEIAQKLYGKIENKQFKEESVSIPVLNGT